MGSHLFIVLMSPRRNTMGLGLFFVLVSLGEKKNGSAYALSGNPLKRSSRGCHREKISSAYALSGFPLGLLPVVDPN